MNVKQVHDETGLDDGFFFLEFIIKCHLFLFLLRLSHLLLSREAIWTFGSGKPFGLPEFFFFLLTSVFSLEPTSSLCNSEI